MKRYNSNFFSFLRWTCILGGLLLTVLAGFYFFNVSAQTETVEKPAPAQNFVNGRLAFGALVGSFGGPQAQIRTANADGTGQVTVVGFPPGFNPSWSPDGTKITYSSGGVEIGVINADGSNGTNITMTPTASEKDPSWSATGKIAYERDSQIWIMNADGSNQMQFPGITQPAPQDPDWSPNGGKLAFASAGEIWTINSDGTGEQRITTNATTDADPAWSPDGTKIIFTKGTSGIAVVNIDGTNEMNLTTVTGDAEADWSPDGTTIAFKRDGTDGGIFLMSANGANQVKIIANTPGTTGTTYGSPVWQPMAQTSNTFSISGHITYSDVSLSGATVNLSGTTNAAVTTDAAGNYQFSNLPAGGNYTVSPSLPKYYFTPPNRSFNNLTSNQTGNFEVLGVCQNGKCVKNGKIAFVRNGEIFTMTADGTNQTNITNNAANDDEPNYSPDGSKIVFSTNRDGNREVYQMNSDGSNPVRLTNNIEGNTSPFYSPDGSTIVFVSNRDGNSEIYKMNADGSNQVRLTNNTANDVQPSFAPDGQKIIFVSVPTAAPRQLYTMNADGSNQQPLSTPANYYARPLYSPDGKKSFSNMVPILRHE